MVTEIAQHQQLAPESIHFSQTILYPVTVLYVTKLIKYVLVTFFVMFIRNGAIRISNIKNDVHASKGFHIIIARRVLTQHNLWRIEAI